MAPNGGPDLIRPLDITTTIPLIYSSRTPGAIFTHLLPASTHARLNGPPSGWMWSWRMDGLKSTPHFKTHDRSVVPPHTIAAYYFVLQKYKQHRLNATVGAKRCYKNRSVTRSRRYGGDDLTLILFAHLSKAAHMQAAAAPASAPLEVCVRTNAVLDPRAKFQL